MMGLRILPLLAALLRLTKAETGDAYHGPPQARELFSYGDRLFYFYSERASYDEANAICEAGNMHLTHLDTPGKAKFAAESIAEAWMVFEDMWIGATKGERGQWIWDWTKKKIPEDPEMLDNYTYLYPPWVDNEIPARDGRNCLAVDRNGHNDPYFVDLDCKLPRPFICEKNVKINKTDPYIGTTVEMFDIEFILYHGRLSWSSAVSFCRQQGFALATVENMSVARRLAKAMLKSRPEFEDAWIGALLKDDQWVWVENEEEIKTIPGEYYDPPKGEIPGNIITPQFPPWFESQPRKGRECVIFDRHLCDEPKFIDLKCNRQRDFICIKREKANETQEVPPVLDRAKKRYIFFNVAATWHEAKKICDEESESTTMLNLTDIEETKFIMQAMSDARKPMDHIWLGGTIIDGKWSWIGRDEEENKPISTEIDEFGFPPWCDNETNIEMACLNLDRQNHWTPLMYGLECNSTQPVVCVQPVEASDKQVEYNGAGVVDGDPSVTLKVTKLVQNPLSWDEAERACSREIGKLWRPRFDLSNNAELLKGFFTNLKNLQEAEYEQYYVDGGVYDKAEDSWLYNKTKYKIETKWEAEHGDCLVGQINKTLDDWAWYPVKCHHKLYSQVICEPRCSLTELPYEADNSEWICDAASSDVFDHKMINMGCNHRCNKDRVLQGPERYQCLKDRGWVNTQANVHVSASTCNEKEVGLTAFKDIPQTTSTLAFVVDSTSDSPADYNASKYLIGHLIDYYKSKLPSVTVFVISIEPDENSTARAAVKVENYIPSGECNKIKEEVLDHLEDTGRGLRDYSAGLVKVKEALSGSALTEAHIVFLVPEANQRGLFAEAAKSLNKEAKVFAIGTNRHAPINQLVEVASTVKRQNFAFQFKNPIDLLDSVNGFVAECAECKCKEEFQDLIGNKLKRKTETVAT